MEYSTIYLLCGKTKPWWIQTSRLGFMKICFIKMHQNYKDRKVLSKAIADIIGILANMIQRYVRLVQKLGANSWLSIWIIGGTV